MTRAELEQVLAGLELANDHAGDVTCPGCATLAKAVALVNRELAEQRLEWRVRHLSGNYPSEFETRELAEQYVHEMLERAGRGFRHHFEIECRTPAGEWRKP